MSLENSSPDKLRPSPGLNHHLESYAYICINSFILKMTNIKRKHHLHLWAIVSNCIFMLKTTTLSGDILKDGLLMNTVSYNI